MKSENIVVAAAHVAPVFMDAAATTEKAIGLISRAALMRRYTQGLSET